MESYKIDRLEFQRVAEDKNAGKSGAEYDELSKEYLLVRNYNYSLVDDYGSGSNGIRTLTSSGKHYWSAKSGGLPL